MRPPDVAARAASRVDLDALPRTGAGEAVLLWRDEHSEGWLNTWWESRDTGYHDHDGSCVGVHVLAGARATRRSSSARARRAQPTARGRASASLARASTAWTTTPAP